ncbi:peptidoglycan-associated outer membrane lipoprotein precursor, partial [Xanthomonas perforans]
MKTRLLVIGLAATATLVGCATSQPQYGSYRGDRGYDQGYSQTQRCVDCGIVTRIDEVGPTRTAPTGTGAVLGGIVG